MVQEEQKTEQGEQESFQDGKGTMENGAVWTTAHTWGRREPSKSVASSRESREDGSQGEKRSCGSR